MSAEQRLELIRRVLTKAYVETETWHTEAQLGAAMAYLCLAIADEGFVDWTAGIGNAEVLACFRLWFPPGDPVWQFILT